jgi:hypothetical protein
LEVIWQDSDLEFDVMVFCFCWNLISQYLMKNF